MSEVEAIKLIGDGMPVPCVGGGQMPYLSLDSAASTPALPAVLERVMEFLPVYSSVHRGGRLQVPAGYGGL